MSENRNIAWKRNRSTEEIYYYVQFEKEIRFK